MKTKTKKITAWCMALTPVFLIGISFDNANASVADNSDSANSYVKDEIIVKYREDKIRTSSFWGGMRAQAFPLGKGIEKRDDLKKANAQVFTITDGSTVVDKVAELKKNADVEYAEPNYIIKPLTINTNDPLRNDQWDLDNYGQTVIGTYGNPSAGKEGSDMSVPEAWGISNGDKNPPVVAVIDTGVAYNHPELINRMWDGSKCKDENGELIKGGCIHGYDYADGDNDPAPGPFGNDYYYIAHGTHAAGTIAAEQNNEKGITGIAPNAKIMAIRYYDVESIVNGIDFVIQNGVKIINMSLGGPNYSRAMYDAIKRFRDVGGIVIAAAGNDGKDNDGGWDNYPSDYNLDNIISVAATDQNDDLASFSNYGIDSVDVGAPGVNIVSSANGERELLNENFDFVGVGEIPNGFTQTGNWQVADDASNGKVLFADNQSPYADDADTEIVSNTLDVSDAASVGFNFIVGCDVPEIEKNRELSFDDPANWEDYIALDISDDNGENFHELNRWDKIRINELALIENGTPGFSLYGTKEVIPTGYLNKNLIKIRFHWVTNATDNNYAGCFVSDLVMTKYTNGLADNEYKVWDGTSMATPHVSGLAALAWGYKPKMTYAEIRNAILTSGDLLDSLDGMIATGKRVNAYKTLQALMDTTNSITSFGFPDSNTSCLVSESDKSIKCTVPYATDITKLKPIFTQSGIAATPNSGIIQNFTNPVTYIVRAENGNEKTYMVNVAKAKESSQEAFPSVDAHFSSKNMNHGVTHDATVKLQFDGIENATEFMISDNPDFNGDSWEPIEDSQRVRFKNGSEKKTYYVKFRNAGGTESNVIKQSIKYEAKCQIKNSKSRISRGETIFQKGMRFSKNSTVLLYFSRIDGSYYPPTKITTDNKGGFSLQYTANKPAGKYYWYAVDEKTGKKSSKAKYVVK